MKAPIVRELNIAEFRGIRRLAKPLELGKFNVLVGRNNVGKTAVLEALYLLAMPFSHYKLPPYGRPVAKFLAELHGGPSSLVYGYAGEAELRYSFTTKVRAGPVVTDSVDIEVGRTGVSRVFFGEHVASSDMYMTFLKVIGAGVDRDVFALYVPDDSAAFRDLERYVLSEEVWSWVEKEGVHSRVVEEVIAPAVYDRFTEVLIRRDRLCLRKEVSGGIGPLYIDVASLGEGVKRVSLVYLAVGFLKPRILLWDDVDVALHPRLAEAVVNWLSRLDAQVVLTTHSIDMLYALLRAYPYDARVLLLRKSRDDVLDYEALGLEELEELVEEHVDPRKVAEALEL